MLALGTAAVAQSFLPGSGASTPAIQQSFVAAYNRGAFPLTTPQALGNGQDTQRIVDCPGAGVQRDRRERQQFESCTDQTRSERTVERDRHTTGLHGYLFFLSDSGRGDGRIAGGRHPGLPCKLLWHLRLPTVHEKLLAVRIQHAEFAEYFSSRPFLYGVDGGQRDFRGAGRGHCIDIHRGVSGANFGDRAGIRRGRDIFIYLERGHSNVPCFRRHLRGVSG